MKTDRIVDRLNKLLEEKYSVEITPADYQEGLKTWKGKRILPVDKWLKKTASIENGNVVLDLSKAFDCFPDSACGEIFHYNSEGASESIKVLKKEDFAKWFDDYVDLLALKRSLELGQMICRNCLLDKTKSESGFLLGIHKMVAIILTKKSQIANNDPNLTIDLADKNVSEKGHSIYPCNVRNFFACPYDTTGKDRKLVHDFESDVQYLFHTNKITSFTDNVLLKASSMTESNETVYEIDKKNNTMKAIQTSAEGSQIAVNSWTPFEVGLNRILKKSIVQVKNKDDIYKILKNRYLLQDLLKGCLSKEQYQDWGKKILDFFDKNKDDLYLDGDYKYTVYENTSKRMCLECGSVANIHLIKSDIWFCEAHYRSNI